VRCCAVAVATGGAFIVGAKLGEQPAPMTLRDAYLTREPCPRQASARSLVLLVDLLCSTVQVRRSGHGPGSPDKVRS
jgi:hypothetical protein